MSLTRPRRLASQTFGASTPEQGEWCDGLATGVWGLAIRPQVRRVLARTKLKSLRKQCMGAYEYLPINKLGSRLQASSLDYASSLRRNVAAL